MGKASWRGSKRWINNHSFCPWNKKQHKTPHRFESLFASQRTGSTLKLVWNSVMQLNSTKDIYTKPQKNLLVILLYIILKCYPNSVAACCICIERCVFVYMSIQRAYFRGENGNCFSGIRVGYWKTGLWQYLFPAPLMIWDEWVFMCVRVTLGKSLNLSMCLSFTHLSNG